MDFEHAPVALDANLLAYLTTFGRLSSEGLLAGMADGTIVFANPAARSLLGLPLDVSAEVCATWLADHLLTPDGEPWPPERLPRHVIAAGATLRDMEALLDTPAGERRFLRISGQQIRADDGTAQGIVMLLRDVTAEMVMRGDQAGLQAHLERVTRASLAQAARLEAVLAGALDGVAIIDLNDQALYVNPAGQQMVGMPAVARSQEELPAYEVRSPEGRLIPPEAQPLGRALRGEKVMGFVEMVRHPDGRELRFDINAGPIYNHEGQITGAAAIFRDVTAQHTAEEERAQRLAELEGLREIARATAIARQERDICQVLVKRLARLLPAECCALLLLDEAAGLYQVAALAGEGAGALNRLALEYTLVEELLSLGEPGQALSLTGSEAEPGSAAATLLERAGLTEAALTLIGWPGRPLGLILAGNHTGGRSFNSTPLRLLQTVAPQATLAIENSRLYERDRSARDEALKRARELARANAELDAFTYSVSHDLRAPLRAIKGFTQLLIREMPELNERAQHQFRRIQANVDKMSNLIDDLLSFSRTGRQKVEAQTVDTGAVVREALRLYGRSLAEIEAQVLVEPLPAVLGDARLLEQVFANLVSNAIKYRRTEEPLRLHIGSRPHNGEVVITVADNGSGFDQRYHESIFQVFQRLHTDDVHEGTGVGLALVRKIVERHGGSVRAEGCPGAGATFFLSLPMAGGA